jgi:hypothetical protein
VHFRTFDGKHFLCAEGGGGRELNATRMAAHQWETFKLEIVGILSPTQVTIDLITVSCRDTEDLTGADEFYLLGAVARDNGPPTPVLTSPININDGQTRGFDPAQARIFDGKLAPRESLALSLIAYDEDVAHDWENRPKWINDMGAKLGGAGAGVAATALASSPVGWATLAGLAVAGAAAGGLLLAVAGDKDDRLGEL